ncbi:MAG: hypothetical protein IKZ82_12880 [Clostridia bacterium]|nr:hypothetical protein [Clostridia bacterium]
MTEPKENINTASAAHGRLGVPKTVLFGIFVAFIGIFFLLMLFLPKREGGLSPNERRILAKAPNASIDNIMHGGFADEVDTWLQDHFPLRTEFVSIYSYANRYTGRNAVEGVVLGSENRLIKAPLEAIDSAIETNIGKLTRFIESNELNAYTYLIPSSGYMLESELPKLHLEYHDGEILDRLEGALKSSAEIIPVRSIFNEQDDVGSLYYKTDHHLTMKGSYLSYVEIARRLGLSPLPESEFTKTPYDFFGTLYGQSCLFGVPCDTLETWVGLYDEKLTVTTADGGAETVHHGSLDTDCLSDDVVDKYAAYLYSNHGVTKIVNESVFDGTLLVLKDSFGNAIVPFLAAHYNTVIMIDVRSLYYSPSLPAPSELCEEYGIDDFLVITGLDTVAEGTLDWLR